MRMKEEDARKTVLACAKKYQQILLNKQMIIIYRERQDNAIRYIEVIFRDKNFQHLTGLDLIDKEGNILRNQSVNFYRKCVENKLGIDEFCFKPDGTAPLKLAALLVLMDITKITKIVGDYNHVRPYLFVDKVMGGSEFLPGFEPSR